MSFSYLKGPKTISLLTESARQSVLSKAETANINILPKMEKRRCSFSHTPLTLHRPSCRKYLFTTDKLATSSWNLCKKYDTPKIEHRWLPRRNPIRLVNSTVYHSMQPKQHFHQSIKNDFSSFPASGILQNFSVLGLRCLSL